MATKKSQNCKWQLQTEVHDVSWSRRAGAEGSKPCKAEGDQERGGS